MQEKDFAKLKKVPKDSPEHILYDLIDHIDTAGDMFKPDNDSAYVKFIYRMIDKAHNVIISDGYVLYYYDEQVDQDSRPQAEDIPEGYDECCGECDKYNEMVSRSETDLNRI